MRSHRGGWLGCYVRIALLALAPVFATTAWAQPGFGPDPFWPYNNQYAPYSRPMGPASPIGGMGGLGMPRQGYAGANQFQDYLGGISGAGRLTTDRAGIGMPYYRSAVDPSWGPAGSRDYRPNAKANATFEHTQRQVTDKYFAYFSERDPKKRVGLLREYQSARQTASRTVNGSGRSPSRALDAAVGGARGSRSPGLSEPLDDRDMPRSSSASGLGAGMGRTGTLAPRSGSIGSARRRSRSEPAASLRSGGRSRGSPSSVLDRAGRMEGRGSRAPGSPATGTRNRRINQGDTPPPPEIP